MRSGFLLNPATSSGAPPSSGDESHHHDDSIESSSSSSTTLASSWGKPVSYPCAWGQTCSGSNHHREWGPLRDPRSLPKIPSRYGHYSYGGYHGNGIRGRFLEDALGTASQRVVGGVIGGEGSPASSAAGVVGTPPPGYETLNSGGHDNYWNVVTDEKAREAIVGRNNDDDVTMMTGSNGATAIPPSNGVAAAATTTTITTAATTHLSAITSASMTSPSVRPIPSALINEERRKESDFMDAENIDTANNDNNNNNSSSNNNSINNKDKEKDDKTKNPFKGMPIIPHKSIGVPKQALNAYYGKKHSGLPITKEAFTTWGNGGKSHEEKFTSVFVCPVTREIFCSGRYGDGKYWTVVGEEGRDGRTVEVVWYSKKTLAEHGAAARAYDSLILRANNGDVKKSFRYCVEEPYLTREEAPPLPKIPVPLPSPPPPPPSSATTPGAGVANKGGGATDRNACGDSNETMETDEDNIIATTALGRNRKRSLQDVSDNDNDGGDLTKANGHNDDNDDQMADAEGTYDDSDADAKFRSMYKELRVKTKPLSSVPVACHPLQQAAATTAIAMVPSDSTMATK